MHSTIGRWIDETETSSPPGPSSAAAAESHYRNHRGAGTTNSSDSTAAASGHVPLEVVSPAESASHSSPFPLLQTRSRPDGENRRLLCLSHRTIAKTRRFVRPVGLTKRLNGPSEPAPGNCSRFSRPAQWKESPQAQVLVALGLSIVNPCFSMVSMKSIVAPAKYGALIWSVTTLTPP